jgi:hypothetical protein
MSRRWFVSSVGIGAANEATRLQGARPVIAPSVRVRRTIGGDRTGRDIAGPQLQLLGPGDVLGFDRGLVVREEPPAGSLSGVESNLACVEFSDASLPWLFSRPGASGKRLPWMVLLVLREDEAQLAAGDPLPVVRAPGAALPKLADSWAWAHVEARVPDAAPNPEADVVADVRSGLQTVISRLICPRQLSENSGWLACVVPATNAGVAAGLGRSADVPDPFGAPWTAGQAEPVRLPVYHAWGFRTGEAGSFEELARLVEPVKAAELEGFGARTIDVRHPWPHADELEGAPTPLTTSVQGALRVPGFEVPEESWSDEPTRQAFVALLRERVDAPATRFGTVSADPDPGDTAVAPPLYGTHFTGLQKVPQTGWPAALNLQVRHRIAAALGTRYAQLEQEFLMARAWEQLGAINKANRLLAVGELSNEAADQAQAKHLREMDPTQVTLLADPIRGQVEVEGVGTMQRVLADSEVPDGAASAPFRRVARPGGGLARRVARVRSSMEGAMGEGMPESPPVVAQCLQGEQILPESVEWVTAQADESSELVGVDRASLPRSTSLVGLLEGQQTLFGQRSQAALAAITPVTEAATSAMGAPAVTVTAPSPRLLRSLRREVNSEEVFELRSFAAAVQLDVATLARSVVSDLRPLGQQLTRMTELIAAPDVEQREESDQRPLRPIMAHPRFGMPIAAELLTRWPEWAVPGITGFPPNSATLLETNSPFVEAVLVGLNQEFNRELLWREFPTDQRGTALARFWPSEVDNPDVDEIARWDVGTGLGDHDETGGQDLLVLLVRADVLRRFPGTTVLAAKSVGGMLPNENTGEWKRPTFVLGVDDQTALFAFDLTAATARADKWLFVLREPMRGTQFGFDARTDVAFRTWADLRWDDVPLARGFVVPRVVDGRPPTPPELPSADPPAWGRDAADVARIAFQRPFQLGISARRLLGEPPL